MSEEVKYNTKECLKVGSVIKGKYKYTIKSILGQGTCGITYLAEVDSPIPGLENNQVAIKEYFLRSGEKTYCVRQGTDVIWIDEPSVTSVVEVYKKYFQREIERIKETPHKNVVKTFEQFEDNHTMYYVMEYGRGDLERYKKVMPEQEALAIIKAISGVISVMHQNNILHLDIKPSNIIVRQNGDPVLIDYGISRKFNEDGSSTSIHTEAPHTAGYAPLEQYMPISTFSPQTDIYALGATLYRMLTAKQPDSAKIIAEKGFPPFSKIISEKTKNAIMYAMQPDLNKRPEDIATFLYALDTGEVPAYIAKEQQIVDDGSTNIDGNIPNANTSIPTELKKNSVGTSSTTVTTPKNNNTRTLLIGAAIVVAGVLGYKYIDDSNKSQDGIAQQDSIGNVMPANNVVETEQPTSQNDNQASNRTKTVTSSTTTPTSNANTVSPTNTTRAVEVVEQPTQTAPVQTPAPAVTEMTAEELLSKGMSASKKFRYEDAVSYFTKAANKGNITAMYLLGDLYYNGNGVDKSFPNAKKYFTQAANGGYVKAQYMLGVMFRNGQGGDKDIDQAKIWLQKAASQGSSEADRMLNKL